MSASEALDDPAAELPLDADSPVDDDPDAETVMEADNEGTAPPPPKPYVFDLVHVIAAAEVLDAAFAKITDSPSGWGQVEKAVKARGGLDEALARELAAVGARSLESRVAGKAGTEFVVHRFRPDPKTASADVVQLWRETLSSVTHPAAAARLEELLLIRRDGRPPDRARHAVISYLGAVTGVDDNLTTIAYLTRAWTISRKFKLADVEDDVLDEIEKRVELPSVRKSLGLVLPLLAVMACEPTNSARQGSLQAAAEKVLADIVATEYMDNVIAEASDLRRKMIVPGPQADANRDATRADEIAALRRIAASASQPGVKLIRLEAAAKYATQHNLRADLKEVQRELEVVAAGDLGLKRIRVESQIPSWISETELHVFTYSRTWHTGMLYFLQSPVPCGDIDKIRAAATDGPPSLRHLMTNLVLGSGGLPRKTLTTSQETSEQDVSQRVAFAAQQIGDIHASGLYRLAQKYGTPAEDEVTIWLLSVYKCDPGEARILAKAFRHFWAEDYLEAAHLATPAVEAAARRLLREMDEGAYQVQIGKNPGMYPSLGTLLDELLRLGMDPSWHYFLTWLLVDPTGFNMRNEIAHGFITSMNPVHATLALRAAALLITAKGGVAGEQKTLTLAAQTVAPRPGLRGIGDRALAVASRLLLRGHMLAESRRRRESL